MHISVLGAMRSFSNAFYSVPDAFYTDAFYFRHFRHF
jgi:hypothetical protein